MFDILIIYLLSLQIFIEISISADLFSNSVQSPYRAQKKESTVRVIKFIRPLGFAVKKMYLTLKNK